MDSPEPQEPLQPGPPAPRPEAPRQQEPPRQDAEPPRQDAEPPRQDDEPPRQDAKREGLTGPLLFALAILLVVPAIAVPNLLNAIQRGKQKRTMGDMRTLATAMESYSIDNMAYVTINARDAAGLARLASYLEPTYVKKLPTLDGWSHPLRIQGTASEYTVTSFGKDGLPDGPASPRPAPNGGTTDFSSDIVFSTGSFVQFPDGTQR